MTTRADDFKQALQSLFLQPLVTQEQTQKFHVSYAETLLIDLEQMIRDCTEVNNQFIFAGHRGSGKSTFLARLSENIKTDYFTVFFSISDLVEVSDINHITILFTIALQLIEKAEQQKIKIPQDKKASFTKWFSKHVKIETQQLGAEVEVGFNWIDLLKGSIKTEASIRDEITTEYTKNFRDLMNVINQIADEIKLASQQQLVVIIDDIDKLDLKQVEEIFYKNLKALLEPRFIVIYTIPIAIIREAGFIKHIQSETGNSIVFMPIQKLFHQGSHREKDPQSIAETFQILKEVLFKRVKPDLMAEGILDQIILSSGGVLSEIIWLARECCRLVRAEILKKQKHQESVDQIYIDDQILTKARNNLRNSMAITLSQADRLILKRVYEKDEPEDPKDEAFLALLHAIFVIEYRNDHSWYIVHPLIAQQLQREKII